MMRFCRLSDVCLSVAYIGPKSRTQRPRKTKIDTEVGNVTCDSDTIFKVKKSMVKVTGGGGIYCGGLPHNLFYTHYLRVTWWSGLYLKIAVSFKIIMTTSVTRPNFTTQHQTCKTKTKTKKRW